MATKTHYYDAFRGMVINRMRSASGSDQRYGTVAVLMKGSRYRSVSSQKHLSLSVQEHQPIPGHLRTLLVVTSLKLDEV